MFKDMKKVSTLNNLLQLTDNEKDILNCFNEDSLETPLALSGKVNIPRPTIYITLEKLGSRGLISPIKIGKRTYWKKTDEQTMVQHIANLRDELLSENTYEKMSVTEDTDIAIYRGEKTILTLFTKLIDEHRGNRLMGIQGDYAGDSWEGVVSLENINKINKKIKEKGLITEIVTSKDWFKRQIDIFGKGWAENFLGRTAQVHFIHNKYLNYKSQIFIFENQLFLVSMEEELFIEIKNKSIAKMIISLIKFSEDYSTPVDINKIVSDLISSTKS